MTPEALAAARQLGVSEVRAGGVAAQGARVYRGYKEKDVSVPLSLFLEFA
jgi:hypothetical protein